MPDVLRLRVRLAKRLPGVVPASLRLLISFEREISGRDSAHWLARRMSMWGDSVNRCLVCFCACKAKLPRQGVCPKVPATFPIQLYSAAQDEGYWPSAVARWDVGAVAQIMNANLAQALSAP